MLVDGGLVTYVWCFRRLGEGAFDDRTQDAPGTHRYVENMGDERIAYAIDRLRSTSRRAPEATISPSAQTLVCHGVHRGPGFRRAFLERMTDVACCLPGSESHKRQLSGNAALLNLCP